MPAARAAGAKAANTPAPIIEPSPITTASPRPSRRARAGVVTVVIPAPSGERQASIAAAIFWPAASMSAGSAGCQDVLPHGQERSGHVHPAERARDEPQVEVRASLAPAVDVHAADVAQREDGALDAPGHGSQGRGLLGRHVGVGVEVRPRRQPHRADQPGLPGVVEGPALVGPDRRRPGPAAEQGKHGSPPASPRRGGSGIVRAAAARRVSGSAYGRFMSPRSTARRYALDRLPSVVAGVELRGSFLTVCDGCNDHEGSESPVDRVFRPTRATLRPGRRGSARDRGRRRPPRCGCRTSPRALARRPGR